MKLEETLKGGYKGLYGEVVKSDCYRLKSLDFRPDVIFDVGANIGIFARYARELFPKALIVCLEPDPENCHIFKHFTSDSRIILVEKALGHGQIYHATTASNGSGEVYLSAGLGYPRRLMEEAAAEKQGLEKSPVDSVRFFDFVTNFAQEGKRHLLKLDCEGAENTIWDHPISMAAMRMMDYIAAEVHFYGQNQTEADKVRERTLENLNSLKETHNCELDNVHFWATKKRI